MTAAVLALLASHGGIASAQSQVGIFGMIDQYVEWGDNGKRRIQRLQSGGLLGSRLGFRGSEDLGGGTKAVFMLESGINADDGSLGQGGLLFGRQAFVGLTGAYGALTVGRQYSPTFLALASYGLGGGMGWGNASVNFAELGVLRVNNSMVYVAPVFNGVTAKLFHALGESATPGQQRVGNQSGGALQYDRGALSANLTRISRKQSPGNSEHWLTAGLSYDFGVIKTGLVAQRRDDDAGLNRVTFYELSATMPLGGGALLLDAGRRRNHLAPHADSRQFGLRYDYFLSKRSTLYGGVVKVSNEAGANVTIGGSSSAGMAVAPGDDPRAVALGVRHVF
ncbi:MAG: porin [Burkholderiaceae bacterium]|nr:porin [Burkholderiaceae bacterium]